MSGIFTIGEFITQMIDSVRVVLMMETMIAFQHIVFLEYITKKQKKRIQIMILLVCILIHTAVNITSLMEVVIITLICNLID